MYNMRHCHAYILVNKSHNNACCDKRFIFACVCNHIIYAAYITCILLWNSGGGGDPSVPPPSVCNPDGGSGSTQGCNFYMVHRVDKNTRFDGGNFYLQLGIKIWRFKVLRVCIGTHALIIFAHKNV